MLCIALSYAEVGSRFDSTGGPYLYTLAAFGPFIAFEVGWMSWFTRVASIAALTHGIALAIGYFAPVMSEGNPRAALIVGVIGGLALINTRGIRQSALFIDGITIAKLVPLAIFIAIGPFFVDWMRLTPLPALGASQVERDATPDLRVRWIRGHGRAGRRDAQSAHGSRVRHGHDRGHVRGDLRTRTDHHHDGAAGRDTVEDADRGLGGDLPGTGRRANGRHRVAARDHGQRDGESARRVAVSVRVRRDAAIPRYFTYIHPRFRTPTRAIWFSAAVALGLALSGSFVLLLAASVLARLVTYAGVSAAALVLRREKFRDRVKPAAYTVPFGPVIPSIAFVVSVAIVFGATGAQLAVGGAALAAGAVLFLTTRWVHRRTA